MKLSVNYMATFCLTNDMANKFRQMITSDKFDIQKIMDMDSTARREFFAKEFGNGNAFEMNALFESKLLLKHQQKGLITWAKQITGMKPEAKRDLVNKILKMDEALTPNDEGKFFNDLISKKIGTEVSDDQIRTINEMANKIRDLKEQASPNESNVALGRAMMDMTDYINDLAKEKANLLTDIAGIPRSLMASLDLSAPLNQGWGSMTQPEFWKNLPKMLRMAFSEDYYKNIQAAIITDPMYSQAKKDGLRLTDLAGGLEKREEQFMTTLLDKFPGLRGSQRAYVGFLNKLRFDRYKTLMKIAKSRNEYFGAGSKVAEQLAATVNNFTGGARVGRLEGATPWLNALLFSPRKIASTLQMLNPVNYLDPKRSKTAKIEATKNLIGSLAMTLSIIEMAKIAGYDEPELNPLSSDFGKIKSGDTRIDISGGNASYITLLSRVFAGKTKSQTGIDRPLGTGFGEKDAWGLTMQSLRYKLSPNASFIVDALSGANAIGQKRTLLQTAKDRMTPMFLDSLVEMYKSDSKMKEPLAVLALFGGGLNTYSQATDWNQSTSKEMLEFKKKVGEKRFKEANDYYNKEYNEWFDKETEKGSYKRLSDEEKEKLIKKKKAEIKKKALKK